MIRLVTTDCWDMILTINRSWDATFVSAAGRVFRSCDPSITEGRIIAAFHEEDVEFSSALARQLITIPLPIRLKNLAHYAGVPLSEDRLSELRAAFEAAIFDPLPDLITGSDTFLAQVKAAHVKLCLISNTGWFSSRAITAALRRRRLIRFFDHLVFSDEVGAAKPSRKIFDVAMAAMASDPSETIHIGNRLNTDIEGALNAGIHAVHFHPHGRCDGAESSCASDYNQVWSILRTHYGLCAP